MKHPSVKRLSIKTRVTLWYGLLLVVICALIFVLVAAAAGRTTWDYCLENMKTAAAMILDEMEYEHGELEIDADIDDVPNVYAALFEADGSLIYGRIWVDAPFEENVMRRVSGSDSAWYIYDVRLKYDWRGDVFLRLHMNADISLNAYGALTRYGFWLLPLTAALALLGGYFVTRRAFEPVKRMAALAASIADGSDLSGRIGLNGQGGDELHQLSQTLDGMLARLETAFNREKRFTSDVAHELRTPMNAIQVQTEFALSTESPEEREEALLRILAKNREMGALVDKLLLLSRMDAGQMPLADECDLAAMLEDIVQDFLPVAEERAITLEARLAPGTLRGNGDLLSRAFVNLIDNAIRYGKSGGRVEIIMERAGEQMCIRFLDDGKGIPEEQLPHVFERFYRADSARSTRGSGIGLSIAQSVAELHHGRIQARNRPQGGAEFTVILPLTPDERPPAP